MLDELDLMKPNILISLAAMFVAILSAIYANRTVKEAQRQNEIAIHNERLKIFKVILELKGEVVRRGVDIKEQDLFVNFYEYVQLSGFYYNSTIYELINDYFKTVWDMAVYHNMYNSYNSREEKEKYWKKANGFLIESREKFGKLEIIMKEQLRLVKPNRSLKKYLNLAEEKRLK